MLLRLLVLLSAAIVSIVAAWVPAADAQKYPTKPIRIIVPYPAGSNGDIVARMFSDYASARLRQTIIIDNRPGGAGIAATDVVAKAEPDGHTLLLTAMNHVSNVGLYPSLPYDPDKDFATISIIGTDYTALVANPKSGFNTVQELIEKAKAKPKSINFASAGIGTGGHLAMELFMKMAGISLVHIPYRGATPAVTDTISGQVPLDFTAIAPLLGHIKGGRLLLLLVSSPKRLSALPDVPTGKDIGLNDFEIGVWWGLLAPAKTPTATVDLLAKLVTDALKDPQFMAKLDRQGTVPGGITPQEFRQFLQRELKRIPQLIREIGIKGE